MNDEENQSEDEIVPTDEPSLESGGGGEITPPTPKTSVSDDMRVAIKDLAKELRGSATAPRDEPEKPLSADERKKLFAIFDPEDTDKEFYSKWFRLNPDATPEEKQQAKDMFAMVHSGLMRQSVTATKLMVEDAMAKLRQEYAPLQDYYSKAQVREMRTRFDDAYPVLSDKRYNKIIAAVSSTLGGKDFADESAFFKALAEGAADAISQIDSGFSLGAAKPTKPSSGTSPRLPRTSAGSSGGAGNGQPLERGGKFVLPMLED